jgi:demethylmenaquinone methyltransferase/2-methoxy-6-polyprenyl-1,4-benzoquinol methylase
MFDRIAPRYDRLNGLISMGAHGQWKRRAIASLKLTPASTVVDLACGTGDLGAEARKHTQRVVGIDFSAGMLAEAARRGDCGALVRADALAMPLADACSDALVCGFALRNFVGLEEVFAECARVLKPRARLALIEVDRPGNALLRAFFDLYFKRFVPVLGAILSDRYAYSYLPTSVEYLPEHESLASMLIGAGFVAIEKKPLLGGTAQLITATRS